MSSTEPLSEENDVTQTTENPAEKTVRNGCLQGVKQGETCRIEKVDDKCSCPTDLTQPMSVKDAMKLSRLLYETATQ